MRRARARAGAAPGGWPPAPRPACSARGPGRRRCCTVGAARSAKRVHGAFRLRSSPGLPTTTAGFALVINRRDGKARAPDLVLPVLPPFAVPRHALLPNLPDATAARVGTPVHGPPERTHQGKHRGCAKAALKQRSGRDALRQRSRTDDAWTLPFMMFTLAIVCLPKGLS